MLMCTLQASTLPSLYHTSQPCIALTVGPRMLRCPLCLSFQTMLSILEAATPEGDDELHLTVSFSRHADCLDRQNNDTRYKAGARSRTALAAGHGDDVLHLRQPTRPPVVRPQRPGRLRSHSQVHLQAEHCLHAPWCGKLTAVELSHDRPSGLAWPGLAARSWPALPAHNLHPTGATVN